jgi:hypothetical protein
VIVFEFNVARFTGRGYVNVCGLVDNASQFNGSAGRKDASAFALLSRCLIGRKLLHDTHIGEDGDNVLVVGFAHQTPEFRVVFRCGHRYWNLDPLLCRDRGRRVRNGWCALLPYHRECDDD